MSRLAIFVLTMPRSPVAQSPARIAEFDHNIPSREG
jgi:hypothetical protein